MSNTRFDVYVQVPNDKEIVVLSNMQETSRTAQDNNMVAVQFAKSPIMSPYLFAIAAGKLKETQATASGRRLQADGYEVHAWAASGRQDNMVQAADILSKALKYFDGFFGVAQPFKRVSIIIH